MKKIPSHTVHATPLPGRRGSPRFPARALVWFPLLAASLSASGLEVWSLADLQKVGCGSNGWTLSASYTLMTNIDASATAGWNSGAGFTPVGTNSSASFDGVFDGNGHVISGLTVNRGENGRAGLFGYVGYAGVVSNLCLTGVEISGAWNVGGLVGENEGTLVRCFVSGTVSGESSAGGLAGSNYGGELNQCYASGTVAGGDGTGGLAGDNYDGFITESYSSAAVSGDVYTGGLVGTSSGGLISDNVFWDTQTSGQSGSEGGGTGRTTAQMKQAATFTGWDFTNVWGIVEGLSYPYLRVLASGGNSFTLTVTARGPGSVTVSPQRATYTPGTNVTLTAQATAGVGEFIRWLGGVAMPSNAVTTVTMDGHKSVTALFRSAREISSITELQQIGNDPGYTPDGRYWLTRHLYAADTAGWNSGAGFKPVGSPSEPFTGIFDGRSNVIARLTIDRGGEDDVGLFGCVGPGAVIRNLGLVYASVTGNGAVGGLAGRNAGGTIERCFAGAQVRGGGSDDIGGLAGENAGGTVRQCYAWGSVAGHSGVGGLVGLNWDGGSVTQCYAACAVTGTLGGVGGLAGGSDSGTFPASYWDAEVSGPTSFTGGVGKTTAELRQQATYAGWDFSAAWGISEGAGAGYPYLRGNAYAYTVSFDAQGGAVDPSSATAVFGGEYGGLPVPARTGYVFGGWWTGAGGTGTPVTNGTLVSVSSNHTLYAQWRSDAFTVSGTGTDATPVGVTNAVQVSTNNFGDGGTSVRLGGVGVIADNQMAGIEWSVTGQGILSFFLRVSSESGYDWLRFYEVGGSATNRISGTQNKAWTNISVTVTGAWDTVHTFRWEYVKDGTSYVGQDCGWVDAVTWTPFHELVVVNGSGDGAYTNGAIAAILADAPAAHYAFAQWTGDTGSVADVSAPGTTLVMPGTGTVVTATYRPLLYTLSVVNGSGSGAYPYGSTVELAAQPYEGKRFYCWTGDVASVANVLAATTTVLTADGTLSVAATYSVPLTVTNGAGTGWYPEGAAVSVTAGAAPLYQDFAAWTGAAAGLLADATAPATTLTMPTNATWLTAVFSNTLSRIAGCYGRTFTTSGTVGGVSADASSGSPSGTPAVKLGGAGVLPDNGSAAFETLVSGSGTVTFWWRVASEADADFLRFLVDSVEIGAISGTKGTWAQVSHRIEGAGTHTLRWEYAKNEADASDLDAGWVDDIVWTGDAPVPALTPEICSAAVTNGVFALDFLGERGIPYTVQTNALPGTNGWCDTAAAPHYASETNGVHRFGAEVTLPLEARAGFFRVRAGTE